MTNEQSKSITREAQICLLFNKMISKYKLPNNYKLKTDKYYTTWNK